MEPSRKGEPFLAQAKFKAAIAYAGSHLSQRSGRGPAPGHMDQSKRL
jgi:hypothetical protein